MRVDYRPFLRRVFYPVAIIATVLALIVATELVGLASAIKGSYALLGILLAYVISRLPRRFGGRFDRSRVRSLPAYGYAKVVVIVWLVALSLALLSSSRTFGLLVGLPIGYALLGIQLRSDEPPLSLLAQTTLLFSLGPLTKYLTNGFVIGDGDIFHHIRITSALMTSGSIHDLGRYADFPNFHLLISMTSFNARLPIYDTMMLVQITAYLTLIAVMFLLTRAATGDDLLSVAVALATTFVYYVSFYTTLVFPQSIATVLVAFLLFVAFRANNPTQHDPLIAIALLTGVSIILLHHLTILLFAPLVAVVLVGGPMAQQASLLDRTHDSQQPLRWLLLAIPGVLAITYWIFEGGFLGELVHFFFRSFLGGFTLTESDLESATIGLGRAVPAISTETALRSLVSPEGIYFIVLVAVFVIGARRLFERPSVHPTMYGFCLAGLLSALLVLRTPIAADFTRLRLPLALFFAFVVAFGLVKLLRSNRVPLPVVVVFVLALGTLSPVVAGDDLYDVHTGESLYEQRPLPEPTREFTDAEFDQLRSVSDLTTSREDEISTIWQVNKALALFSDSDATDPDDTQAQSLQVTEEGFTTERELFVYQTRWPDHRHVHFNDVRHSTIVMSEAWLDGTAATENKVYSGGEVEVLWREDGGTFGQYATDEVDEVQTATADRGDESDRHRQPLAEPPADETEDEEAQPESETEEEAEPEPETDVEESSDSSPDDETDGETEDTPIDIVEPA